MDRSSSHPAICGERMPPSSTGSSATPWCYPRDGRSQRDRWRHGPPPPPPLRPPHLPVRTVRVGQDVRARRAARAAPAGDEPAHGDARPELGLRPHPGARAGAPRAGRAPQAASRSRAGDTRVAPYGTGCERLRLRFAELGTAGAAAALHLDPVRDREEYSELSALLDERTRTRSTSSRSDRPGAAALSLRARNLGLHTWGIWARDDAGSSLDALEDRRCAASSSTSASLATRDEQALVGEAVLDRLWHARPCASRS